MCYYITLCKFRLQNDDKAFISNEKIKLIHNLALDHSETKFFNIFVN